MTSNEPATPVGEDERRMLSLCTAAARVLATTTKTVPNVQGTSPRWLLRMLPWVEAKGGAYRVNRRLTYTFGDGLVSFSNTGDQVQVIPGELAELPLLRGIELPGVLQALAERFVQRDVRPGETVVRGGDPADAVYLVAHGKMNKVGVGEFGDDTVLDVLAEGEYFGDHLLAEQREDILSPWPFSIRAVTRGTVMVLPRAVWQEVSEREPALREQVRRALTVENVPRNKYGEADIELASGHSGEPAVGSTFVDYELSPREYELSVAQTILRVHTRVADLYNQPMNQVEQQLRITVEALRERQEADLVNNSEFGLLHNVALKQRIHTRTGPPTPDDLDELLCRRRKSRFFLAHPRAIAAFGRECTKRGVYPEPAELDGAALSAWRGVPILPCDKIPINANGTTSVLVMRTGEDDHGVVGLRQTGFSDEIEPGLTVRFTGIDEQALMSYLVSTYYSAAVLVPDALGVLDDVELGR